MSGEIRREISFKSKRDLAKQKSDNSVFKRSFSVYKSTINSKRTLTKDETSKETQTIESKEYHRSGCINGLRRLRQNRRQTPLSSVSQDKVAKNSKIATNNHQNKGVNQNNRGLNCFCSKMEQAKQSPDRKFDLKQSKRYYIVKNFDSFSKKIHNINGKLSEETINIIFETIKANLDRTNDKNKIIEKKELKKIVSNRVMSIKELSSELGPLISESKAEISEQMNTNQRNLKKKKIESSACNLNNKNINSQLNLIVRSKSQPVKLNSNNDKLQIITEENEEEDNLNIVKEKSNLNFDRSFFKKLKCKSNNCLQYLPKQEIKEKEKKQVLDQNCKNKNGLKSKSPFKDRFTVELKSVNNSFKKELSCNITFSKK